MFLGGINVGQGRIYNVYLQPGNNTVELRATANLKTLLSNIGPILASQATALQLGNIEITASGNSTIYNGLHIPYFEHVLNNLTVSGNVAIVQILVDSLKEFLGTDTGSLLTGVLSNLNITSLLDGLVGTGNSSTSGLGSLTGLLTGLTNSTSSSNFLDVLLKTRYPQKPHLGRSFTSPGG